MRSRALCLLLAAAARCFADYVPDGREWEDHSRLSFGTIAPRAAFGSFPDASSARQVLSSLSPRTVSLDGETEWRFKWSRRPAERPAGFERPDYDVSGWDAVKVPCSWQAMGARASGERFGTPIYVNQNYIFAPPFPANSNCWPRVTGNGTPESWTFSQADNPVGSYRREFSVPASWAGDRVILRFDGVESFFYAWVNGRCIGFSKDSRAVAEFDITDKVHVGENTLAVEVYRSCDGSYLECHDAFRLSGIHRSVYLSHVPAAHIRDVSFSVSPLVPGAYGGRWALSVSAQVEGPGAHRLRAEVFAQDGSAAPFEGGEFGLDGSAKMVFGSPALWSAETPALYALVVVLEVDGRVAEAAGFDLGFRESSVRGASDPRNRVWTFNGRPVKLKGVNRGESDPMYGHHVPDARLEEDLALIKRANFNFVRNSHFPQPERFYHLANRLGLYVMDEANIESHGYRFGPESLSHEPSWRQAHIGRVRAMYERSKNQPCVVFWSLGNEAGPGANLAACADWIRSRDGSRPLHYERNNEIADVGSCFYPTLELARGIADADGSVKLIGRPVRYPFLFVEYAHNLNNNCGNLLDFQRILESEDRMMGGALWDFADQALWMRTKSGKVVAAWGGCFGEQPEEGQGIMDGIVTADRCPEPGYHEARHVFQPFSARLSADRSGIEVVNKHYFTDLSLYDARCTVLTNGLPAWSGPVRLRLAPQARGTIPVPEPARRLAEACVGEVDIRISLAQKAPREWCPAGFVVAEEQMQLSAGSPVRTNPPASRQAPSLSCDGERVTVSADGLSFAFSRSSGELASLRRGEEELFSAPMTLDAFRAPVGGETHLFAGRPCFGRLRLMDGLRSMRPRLCRLFSGAHEGGVRLETEIVYVGERKEDAPGWGHGNGSEIVDLGPLGENAPQIRALSRWDFRRDGRIILRTTFRPEGRRVELQRLGWRIVWNVPRTDVRYFARGPHDNYSDRKSCCFPAVYVQPSDAFGFAYGCSQDGGSREEARFVAMEGPGVELSAVDGGLFAFAVSPYSPSELLRQSHPELLPEPSKTELGLYAKVRGLGSANCGPEPKAEDRLPADGEFSLGLEWANCSR